ncbi:MAG: phage Gp37/Gp68 family protein [Phycisphaerae bacterium]
MSATKIEWADATWNPITGCTPISAGCRGCYAKRMANRLRGRCGYPADEPFKPTFHPDKLDEPLRWKKPRRIFVCSMGDLFHEDVSAEWIAKVLAIVKLCPQHTFMVLTKRPERMHWFFVSSSVIRALHERETTILSNLWLGTTCEDQAAADERLPWLLRCPSAVRFVSHEPALGAVDWTPWLDPLGQESCINCGADERRYLTATERAEMRYSKLGDALCRECGEIAHATGYDDGIDWLITGAPTGPGAPPMHPDIARSDRDQCAAAGVPWFFKGWGEWRSWNTTSNREIEALPFDPPHCEAFGEVFVRVGRKRAGRRLDGKEHNEFPHTHPAS